MKSVIFQTVSGSPDTAEWHTWRAGGIGGSDAPVIAHDAGLCSKATWMKGLHNLWLLKTGQIQAEDLSRNPAIRRGKEGEEPARLKYEEKTGILVKPAFGEMDIPGMEFIRASLDGLNFGHDVFVEIKCPGSKVHDLAKFGKIPDYYKPQMAHQGLVTWGPPEGWNLANEIHYASYVPETDEIEIVEKRAKDFRKLAEDLMKAEIAFWDRVRNQLAPCGEEWLTTAAAYIAADARVDAAKVELETLKTQLITLLDAGKSLEGGGVTAARRTTVGRVNTEQLLSDLMPGKTKEEIEAYSEKFRGKSTESITVTIAKTAKAAKQVKEVA